LPMLSPSKLLLGIKYKKYNFKSEQLSNEQLNEHIT
jgi:hypothetical protein